MPLLSSFLSQFCLNYQPIISYLFQFFSFASIPPIPRMGWETNKGPMLIHNPTNTFVNIVKVEQFHKITKNMKYEIVRKKEYFLQESLIILKTHSFEESLMKGF